MTIQEKVELLAIEKIPAAIGNAYDVGYETGYMEGDYNGWETGWNDGYTEGEQFGYETGYYEGIEEGKIHEHNTFWDAFQDYGKREYYERAFTGYNFNASNLYPKYDIIVKDIGTQVFYAWSNTKEQKFDLAGRLRECGVVLDTSQAKVLDRMFAYGRFSTIPTIDMSSITDNQATHIFSYAYDNLETVEKIIIHEKVRPDGWFYNCTGLKNLTIEGKLAQNGFNVSSCSQLTKESILSIVEALSLDITETKTITFSTAHRDLIEGEMPNPEPDAQGNHSVEFLIWAIANDAKMAGWSFVYA